jgi:monoamine oxidase
MSMGAATAHVVGAGLAGLAAAVELAAAGRRVRLYEAALHAGGRCRSYFDGARLPDRQRQPSLLASNNAALRYLDRSGALYAKGPQDAVFPFSMLRLGSVGSCT